MYTQIGKGSANFSTNFSMLSEKKPVTLGSSSVAAAVYKGVTVSVYTVDKTDIILTRQDVIQLIDVCILFSRALSPSHILEIKLT